MKYVFIILLFLSLNSQTLALNCSNPASNISDEFIYGFAVTQVFLGSLQIVLSFVPFISDYIFYRMSHSQRVIEKEAELKKAQDEHESLIKNEPNITLEVLKDVKAYIEHSESSSSDSIKLAREQKIIGRLKQIRGRMLEIATPNPQIHDPESPDSGLVLPNEFELNQLGIIQ